VYCRYPLIPQKVDLLAIILQASFKFYPLVFDILYNVIQRSPRPFLRREINLPAEPEDFQRPLEDQ